MGSKCPGCTANAFASECLPGPDSKIVGTENEAERKQGKNDDASSAKGSPEGCDIALTFSLVLVLPGLCHTSSQWECHWKGK